MTDTMNKIVYFNGRYWFKMQPVWVSGYRPAATYIPLNNALQPLKYRV